MFLVIFLIVSKKMQKWWYRSLLLPALSTLQETGILMACPSLCMLLPDNCSHRLAFSAWHCVTTLVVLQHQRVKFGHKCFLLCLFHSWFIIIIWLLTKYYITCAVGNVLLNRYNNGRSLEVVVIGVLFNGIPFYVISLGDENKLLVHQVGNPG